MILSFALFLVALILIRLLRYGVDYYLAFCFVYVMTFVGPVVFGPDDSSVQYFFVLVVFFVLVTCAYFSCNLVFGPRAFVTECMSPLPSPRYYVVGTLLSVIVVIGYGWDQGGILKAIAEAGFRRAMINYEPTRFGFLITLAYVPVVFLASALTRVLSGGRHVRMLDWMMVMLFGALAIVGFLESGGRSNFIFTAFMLFALMSFWVDRKKLLLGAILVLPVAYVVIAYGKTFTNQLGLGAAWSDAFLNAHDVESDKSFGDLIYNNFGYLEQSFACAQRSDLRWYFQDMFWGWLNIIPKAILPIDVPPNISYYNTQAILGEFEGIIPPGLIAYGFLSCGWLGFILSAVVYGFVGGALDWRFKRDMANRLNPGAAVAYVCGIFWAFVPTVGDPVVYYKSLFVQIIVIGVYFAYARRSRGALIGVS